MARRAGRGDPEAGGDLGFDIEKTAAVEREVLRALGIAGDNEVVSVVHPATRDFAHDAVGRANGCHDDGRLFDLGDGGDLQHD